MTTKTTARSRPSRATFSGELRDAIDRSGLTHYALGDKAGVDPGIISRFMRDERAITSVTADRLISALGLHLASPVKGRGRPRKGGLAAGPEPANA
jgi:hypothetical protein